jgi:hypothetical protein
MTPALSDRFEAFAVALAARRRELAEHLGWQPQVGRPVVGHDPSLEAAAKRRISELRAASEVQSTPSLFHAYIEAVNALWLLAEQNGVTEQLVREYRKAHRGPVRSSGVDRQDLSAEATMAMREQCIGWACLERRTAALGVYARPGIYRALSAFVGREASATTGMGVHAARSASKRSNRVPVDAFDEQAERRALAEEEPIYEYDSNGWRRPRR